jgi:hypothetical protein
MAFQAGPIKISGSFGDISFYESVFGWLARTKGGPTRKQFKTSPKFERSRENSSEFTNCSQAASLVRRTVFRYTRTKDKTLFHRLMSFMRLLADADPLSSRGARDPMIGMLTDQGMAHLKSFEIAKGLNLYDVLLANGFLNEPETAFSKNTDSVKRKRHYRFTSRPAKQKPFPEPQRIVFVLGPAQKQTLVNTAFG